MLEGLVRGPGRGDPAARRARGRIKALFSSLRLMSPQTREFRSASRGPAEVVMTTRASLTIGIVGSTARAVLCVTLGAFAPGALSAGRPALGPQPATQP